MSPAGDLAAAAAEGEGSAAGYHAGGAVGDGSGPSSLRSRLKQIAVWLVLVCTLAGSLLLIAEYGDELPRADEWVDTAVILGDEAFTWGWLWEPHNVHRAPVSRFLRLVFYRTTHAFRTALFFNVLVMGAAAAILLRAVERCRGAPSLQDILIPLLLVGPAHYKNFFWGFQVAFTVSSALFVVTLALVVSLTGRPSSRRLALVGGCLMLQVLTGANGIALALPMLAWLVIALSSGGATSRAWHGLGIALVAATALVIALYPIGLNTQSASLEVGVAARTTLAFLGTAFGAEQVFWQLKAAIVLVLAVAAPMLLSYRYRYDAEDRWRISGMAACVAAAVLVAVFVGVGRGHMGVQPRYTTLAVALPSVSYVIFALFARGRSRTAVPIVLLVLAIPGTVFNGYIATRYGEFRRLQVEQLRDDVERGLPVLAIAARNGSTIHPNTEVSWVALRRLIARRAWPFEDYAEDDDIERHIVSRTRLQPDWVGLHDLRRDGEGFIVTGPHPHLLLRLESALPLAAIELDFVVDEPRDRIPFMRLRWDHAGDAEPDFPPWGRTASSAVGLTSHSLVRAWIYDLVDTVRIETELVTSRFEIRDITLLKLAPGWQGELRPSVRDPARRPSE